MRKISTNYRTITLKLDKTDQLDMLARECGRIYSKTISYVRKVHDKKGLWLDANQMQKIITSDKLHSQTTQAVIQKYFASLKSYFANLKTNPKAKPPHKTHKYFEVPFKESAIRVKNGFIYLSCGANNLKVIIPIPIGKTLSKIQYAEIVFDGRYYLKITTKLDDIEYKSGDKFVAVDPGEIHPLTVWDGGKGTIYNGRLLRSVKQYREKIKADYSSKIDTKKKGSNRRHELVKSKKSKLRKLDNKIRDIEHKITRHFVETCKRDDVSTVVYGDTTHIRDSIDFRKKVNQKLHQWNFDRIRFQVAYKLAKYGINFKLIDERGTSHTCPVCGHHVNPVGRKFRCINCGFETHRDIAGSMNIYSKYQEPKVPVVASMAHATGVRFNYHLRCSDLPLRIPQL